MPPPKDEQIQRRRAVPEIDIVRLKPDMVYSIMFEYSLKSTNVRSVPLKEGFVNSY
jgi:hypothetical protein